MTKRLFLFASHDRDDVIDDYVVYYVRALSELGDVVFWMDNDAAQEELAKVLPFTIYAQARQHRSYDFGSYKRAYQWAHSQGILNNYDFLYICNDSCFGPFRPLKPALEDMERQDADWFGFTSATDDNFGVHYIISWFIGMRPRVFLADWWKCFINSITQESDKKAYIYKYEHFVSRLAQVLGVSSYSCLEPGNSVYDRCYELLVAGMPFIKRLGYFAFSRKSSIGGYVSRAHALQMLETAQREMVLKYIRRMSPATAWLVMHPRVYWFLAAFKRSLKSVLGIKVTSSRRKERVVRVFGIPLFYRNRPKVVVKSLEENSSK